MPVYLMLALVDTIWAGAVLCSQALLKRKVGIYLTFLIFTALLQGSLGLSVHDPGEVVDTVQLEERLSK